MTTDKTKDGLKLPIKQNSVKGCNGRTTGRHSHLAGDKSTTDDQRRLVPLRFLGRSHPPLGSGPAPAASCPLSPHDCNICTSTGTENRIFKGGAMKYTILYAFITLILHVLQRSAFFSISLNVLRNALRMPSNCFHFNLRV